MLSLPGKQLVFDISRCAQCGLCLAACPSKALLKRLDKRTGLTHISAASHCVACGKCVAVCPARILPDKQITGPVTPRQVVLSAHIDDSTRKAASSGAAIRGIVRQALEKGLVEHAYLLLKDDKYPWAKGCIAGKDFDMASAANSMYLPVLAGENLDQVPGGKSILVVGTACQLYGAFRLLRKRYETVYSVAVFCKQQKTLYSSRHFAKRLGVEFSFDGPPMQYRGNGWPGFVQLGGKAKAWRKMASFPYGQRLWRVPGCRLCPDPFCLEADISVADPWGIDSDSATGRSLLAIWSANGEKLVDNAAEILVNTASGTDALLESVEFDGILRKSQLTAYYAGKKVTSRVRIAGILERSQIALLEFLDKTLPIPEFGYRVLARLPLLAHILLKK